ncbi:tRNA (adenosine(37)-N6)-dimethylallyltransferase MiaA [Leptolyngbya sp. FACHB-36]|uniref:tRNA (adenosine(37)-N6)-dimethylallyltransferase MiaA n=1 Tax=Leptolyngbya sp. FACHB-36 TaxID=2692808 RepID=UPI0016801BAC|nr:tRNA (adenosine(37)-N6)-dimethylallyltransferase MiaA [Leptolyngbya sp. FACHB-36]MBD2019580.1 tRNA (adenosine(37)-N6)-dimethylallyltransferase MiaA [Leptolyngbya sp. FACHB-36]
MFPSDTIIAKINTPVPGLIVLCGPTAAGKSSLAIALAQRLHTSILSADSRQVYREFDIGTAKPSGIEQQQAPHYLIDLCDPTETLTVAEYQQQAQGLIEQIHQGKHTWTIEQEFKIQNSKFKIQNSLLVGGTGLYIRSIVRGLQIPQVPPQSDLRLQLQALGQAQCYAMLQQVDQESAAKIHPNDAVRTLRSLEVFYVTGRPLSQQQGEDPPTYPILQIGLDSDNLQRRIETRTAQMVEAGLVAEVEHLCQKYGSDLPLLNTLGYAEFKRHLAGDFSLSEAQRLTVLHTRQFAKRQRTWFRADSTIDWFDADAADLLERVWQRITKW